jgi:hypothetical protein
LQSVVADFAAIDKELAELRPLKTARIRVGGGVG